MSTIGRCGAIAAASLGGVLVLGAVSHATPGKCQRTILEEAGVFASKTIKTLRMCEEFIVKEKPGFPLGLDCLTEPTVAGKIMSREDNLRKKIRSTCGGKNKTCNAVDTGNDADESLASIGWDLGTCPDFEGVGCTNAIADCNDIATCLICINRAAEDQAMALLYEDLILPSKSNKPLNKCQRTIGNRTVKFFQKKLKLLQKCQARVLSGDIAGPCPDPKTQEKIATAESKKVAKICKKCGGANKSCGGGDDLGPGDIGFAPTCPDVTVPGGPACAGAVSTLDDIVSCVDCVAEFKVDCVDALRVPAIVSYPAECNPGGP